MHSKPFDFLVFIGRFQPFHAGHLAVVQAGLAEADKLIILIGSAWAARSVRNPWTVQEREAMLRESLSSEANQQIITAPLMDVPYNDELWVRNVQSTVSGLVTAHHATPHKSPRVGLIGHSKDQTSYYLKLFPQWDALNVANVAGISATPLREALFGVGPEKHVKGKSWLESAQAAQMLPVGVVNCLNRFCDADAFSDISDEHAFVAHYRRGWESAPYAPTFVTVDAVVIQSGHVLLIERKARPGKGQWALPGGFLNPHERLVEGCLRELREETRLKVPAPVLKGSIKRQQVFDDPHRSSRGRTITHAFYIELEPAEALPKVRGGDDAKQAFWVPLSELTPEKLFEDHYFIIQELLGAS